MIGHERAGESRDAAGDDEDDELVRVGREADGGRAPLVVANAADHHAELRLDDPVREQHDQHQQNKHDVIEGRVIGEGNEPQTVALGQGEAVVAAPIAQALGEVVDHLGKRERHHDELEAARAQRERSDRQCEQHRYQNGERPGHEGVTEAVDRQHARGVGADAEQRRLPEGDQPAIAEQKVDAERRHAVDGDLRRESGVIGAAIGRQHDRDGEQKEEQRAASKRHLSPDARQTGRCG